MNRDVYLNKRQSILDCLKRVAEKHEGVENPLADLDRKEIILLNLQRACEMSIDLAMHVVADGDLGIPQDSRDAFRLLEKAGQLNDDVSKRMQQMVGFRNIAVHQYQAINDIIVERIVAERLSDFTDFLDAIKPTG
jgi:uncharacterized protein YutE (UPF0331/DUF86 family)